MTLNFRTKIGITILIVGGGLATYSYLYRKPLETPPIASGAENKSGKGDNETISKSAIKGGTRVVPVDVYVADYVRIEEGIRAVGTLVPFEEVILATEIAGKVACINFEEGQCVKKGQLLLKINDDDLQAQFDRAVFQRNTMKEKLDRNRILLQKEAVSREAFDQIETDYNVLESDIELLQVKINRTEIRAPFDGVIGFRTVSLGSYLQPGTTIANLVDGSKLRVQFSIPEKYVNTIQVTAPINFMVQGDETIHGARVYAVDSKVDETTRTIAMRAMYNNIGLKLKPGMFANVNVGEKVGTTIQVPTQAIVPESTSKRIWLVKNGKAILVPVKTGIRGETMIEIEEGIVKGDSVITTGLLQLKENAPVLIN